eukprot:403364674
MTSYDNEDKGLSLWHTVYYNKVSYQASRYHEFMKKQQLQIDRQQYLQKFLGKNSHREDEFVLQNLNEKRISYLYDQKQLNYQNSRLNGGLSYLSRFETNLSNLSGMPQQQDDKFKKYSKKLGLIGAMKHRAKIKNYKLEQQSMGVNSNLSKSDQNNSLTFNHEQTNSNILARLKQNHLNHKLLTETQEYKITQQTQKFQLQTEHSQGQHRRLRFDKVQMVNFLPRESQLKLNNLQNDIKRDKSKSNLLTNKCDSERETCMPHPQNKSLKQTCFLSYNKPQLVQLIRSQSFIVNDQERVKQLQQQNHELFKSIATSHNTLKNQRFLMDHSKLNLQKVKANYQNLLQDQLPPFYREIDDLALEKRHKKVQGVSLLQRLKLFDGGRRYVIEDRGDVGVDSDLKVIKSIIRHGGSRSQLGNTSKAALKSQTLNLAQNLKIHVNQRIMRESSQRLLSQFTKLHQAANEFIQNNKSFSYFCISNSNSQQKQVKKLQGNKTAQKVEYNIQLIRQRTQKPVKQYISDKELYTIQEEPLNEIKEEDDQELQEQQQHATDTNINKPNRELDKYPKSLSQAISNELNQQPILKSQSSNEYTQEFEQYDDDFESEDQSMIQKDFKTSKSLSKPRNTLQNALVQEVMTKNNNIKVTNQIGDRFVDDNESLRISSSESENNNRSVLSDCTSSLKTDSSFRSDMWNNDNDNNIVVEKPKNKQLEIKPKNPRISGKYRIPGSIENQRINQRAQSKSKDRGQLKCKSKNGRQALKTQSNK